MNVGLALADAWCALVAAGIIVHAFWPWDLLGKRREVVLRRGRRPFE